MISALPPKADMCIAVADVRYGPEADIVAVSIRPLNQMHRFDVRYSKDEKCADDKADTRSACCRLLAQSGRGVKREDKISSFDLLVAEEATFHQRPAGDRFAILEVTKSPSAGRGVLL